MDLATRDTGTAFADVICADPQWLREEFDALIAQAFGRPPLPPRPAPPRVPPCGGPRHPLDGARSGAQPAPAFPARAWPGRRRQRSPPA
jgi:hypothetical protein